MLFLIFFAGFSLHPSVKYPQVPHQEVALVNSCKDGNSVEKNTHQKNILGTY